VKPVGSTTRPGRKVTARDCTARRVMFILIIRTTGIDTSCILINWGRIGVQLCKGEQDLGNGN